MLYISIVQAISLSRFHPVAEKQPRTPSIMNTSYLSYPDILIREPIQSSKNLQPDPSKISILRNFGKHPIWIRTKFKNLHQKYSRNDPDTPDLERYFIDPGQNVGLPDDWGRYEYWPPSTAQKKTSLPRLMMMMMIENLSFSGGHLESCCGKCVRWVEILTPEHLSKKFSTFFSNGDRFFIYLFQICLCGSRHRVAC